jgi:hypothetical protein
MRSVGIFVFLLCLPVLAWALEKEVCFECHGKPEILSMSPEERKQMVTPSKKKGEWPQGLSSLYIDPDRFASSSHGGVNCVDCHNDISEVPHPQSLVRVDCSLCHKEIAETYESSGHPALCYQCHNPHYVKPTSETRAKDRNSPCLNCHKEKELLSKGYPHCKHILQEKVSCTVCHNAEGENRVFIFVKGQAPEGIKADANGDGFVSYDELKSYFSKLKEKGSKVKIEAELLPLNASHNYVVKEESKDCLTCHSPKLLTKKPILVLPNEGKPLETDPSIFTRLSDFYPIGSDRFTLLNLKELISEKEPGSFESVLFKIGWRWLDIVGYIFLVGAILFVGLHGVLRILTLKWRKKEEE